jgi:hypothetical protein
MSASVRPANDGQEPCWEMSVVPLGGDRLARYSGPECAQRGVAGGCPSDAGPCSSSVTSRHCHDWHRSSLDKPSQRGFGNSDVPTHVDELDSMLGDESANEAGSRIQ